MPFSAYFFLSLELKCPELGCEDPKAGRLKLEVALLSKNHTDPSNIESNTTGGFWKYAVSLNRHTIPTLTQGML